MIFNAVKIVSEKYPNRLAINQYTFSEIIKMVERRDYNPVCHATDWSVLLDILKASSLGKTVKILPKYRREDISVSDNDYGSGIVLFSSGSTGTRKEIFIPESMILKNAEQAIKCQGISSSDKILTVCSLNHTGGINAQTLAGLMVGAHVIVESFNAYSFYRILDEEKVTVTHLIPAMIDMLDKAVTKRSVKSLRLVVAGSDCLYRHHVEYWISQEIPFMINYGMTEAGPIIINHKFEPGESLEIFQQGVPLGTDTWCDVKVEDGELFLRGSNVNSKDWLPTGDCVEVYKDWFIYKGRKSAGCKIIPKAY